MQLQASSRAAIGSRPACSTHRQRCSVMRAVSRTQQAATAADSSSSAGGVWRADAALQAAVLAAAALLSGGAPAAFADEALAAAEQVVEGPFAGYSDPQKAKLKAAEDTFKSSDTLKALLQKSEANKAKNKREIANKYCYRQAEMGIGDCGGLRYIPGMTKNGKQATPEWLQKALGVDVPEVEGQGKTLRDLLGPDPDASGSSSP